MEWWLLGFYVLIDVFLLTIIFLVLYQNGSNSLNRSFSHFLIGLLAWSSLNYVSNLTILSNPMLEALNHALLSASSIAMMLLVHFCAELLEFKSKNALKSVNVSIGLLGAVIALTPLVMSGVVPQEGVVGLEFGVLAPVYFLCLASMSVLVIYMLTLTLIKQGGTNKQRAIVMLSGISATLLLALVTNAIIPLLTGNFLFTLIGPVFSTFLIVATGYAIIKHKLFDIRAVAARGLAYVLSIALLVILYTGLVFGIIENTFSMPESSALVRTIYTIVAIALSLTFQSVKHFFDKVTDKIFFRHDYKLDEVIDMLGDATVDATDLKQLTGDAQRILHQALRPSYIVFAIMSGKQSSTPHYFATGNAPSELSSAEAKNLIRSLDKQLRKKKDRNVFRRDAEEGNSVMRRIVSSYDADVIFRMKTTHELNGYMLIGSKQNGLLYSKKDMQLLGTAADELALAIQNALRFEEIRAFNRTLQEKVEVATAKLRRTNEKLRELDEAKDEFVSMASHQLRTPLTSVKGYLSMVIEGDAGELKPTQKKLLEEAYAGSQRMVYLISDFLNVSRIKTGRFAIEYDKVNLASVINEEIGQLRIAAEERNMKFVYEAPGAFPVSRMDENKIRQVIMNLIDNAIFYSKPGGTIKVELYTQDRQIVFRVKDSGIGVPAKEQHGLFEKFYRASNARSVRPDGTGLGLFMIKKVVLAHGGTIIFNSVQNQGSTFGFALPLRKTQTIPVREKSAVLELVKK